MRRKLLVGYFISLGLLALSLLSARPLYAAPQQGDEVVLNDDLTLREGELINGDLVMLGGNLYLQAGSRVEGSVTVFGGRVEVDGTVGGELIALGGDVVLNTHASVQGKVMALGGNLSQVTGARTGEIVQGPVEGVGEWRWPFFSLGANQRFWSIVWSAVTTFMSALVMALLGVAVVTFWPAQTNQVGETIVLAPLPSLGVGCLLYPLAGSLSFFLLITLCLSPFAPAVALLLVAASLFGWIALGTLWGRWLMRWLGWRRATLPLTVGVGTFTLTIMLAIAGAVPCLGPLLIIGVASLNLGAVALSRFGASRYRGRPQDKA
jgi:hypothetical protein